MIHSQGLQYSGLLTNKHASQESPSDIFNHVQVGPVESPPPYKPTEQLSSPVVQCRVCQTMIEISDRRERYVVKCSNCKEATPIKSAPLGKKYVRCPCKCLLICNSKFYRIACPRPNCQKIINLPPPPLTPSFPVVPGRYRVSCVYCANVFLFNCLQNAPATCPHCHNISSVGPHFARSRGVLFLTIGFIFLLLGFGITFGTYQYAKGHGGKYIIYLGAFIIAFISFWLSACYYRMKISTIEGAAS